VISDPKRLRIALVNALDSSDRRVWSRTNYYIAQALQKHCGDVSYIGPIAHDLEKALGTVFSKSARLLSGKRYMSEVSFLFARRFAHSVAQHLAQASFDVIVASCIVPDVEYSAQPTETVDDIQPSPRQQSFIEM